MVLAPFPAVGPLAGAAVLAALGEKVPRRVADAFALLVCAGVFAASLALAYVTRDHTWTYWFGGWAPRGPVAVGVAFSIDPRGAAFAALAAFLVGFALLFTVTGFEIGKARFHALMLVFLGAICGLVLSGDLFNMFVWFELMSAASFALCAYKSRDKDSLQGAINLGITNTVGAFFTLTGVALVYGKTGALNLEQIGRALSQSHDPLVPVAFALVASGFLIKAAMVPFHFWLADAHATAPTAVCVLFSGVMVESGVYAVWRVHDFAFAPALAAHAGEVRAVFVAAGLLTAVTGAAMAFVQRHLKRLLAFSTVAHVGVMLVAFGLQSTHAAAPYIAGHGLAKGALFVLVGIVLHQFRSVDAVALHSVGLRHRWLGVLFLVGVLALSGAPGFATFTGDAALDEAAKHAGFGWASWVLTACTAVVAAAILRAVGRIFFGLGPLTDLAPDAQGQTTEAPETAKTTRVPAPMIVSAAAMLVGAVVARFWIGSPVELHAEAYLRSLALFAVAVALTAAVLWRERFPRGFAQSFGRGFDAVVYPLRRAHSGEVGDYVAWIAFGVAALGGVLFAVAR